MEDDKRLLQSHRKSDICTPKGNIDGSLVRVISQTVVFNWEEHQTNVINEQA